MIATFCIAYIFQYVKLKTFSILFVRPFRFFSKLSIMIEIFGTVNNYQKVSIVIFLADPQVV